MSKVNQHRISVSLAEPNDLKHIFLWRNDPVSCEQSLGKKPISWKEHKLWFERVLNSEEHCLLMCFSEILQTNIGVVRFDIVESHAVVSINLAPDLRGQGLGRPCLSAAINRFGELFEEICSLTATVRSSNEASLRLFRQIGFEEIKETRGLVSFCLRLNRVV